MKVFTFTKDELKTDAVSLGYVPCVEEFFKALGLGEVVTVTFRDDSVTSKDAFDVIQETISGAWCGHADNLNDFLCFRAASLADDSKIKLYGFRSREKDGVIIVRETLEYFSYGPQSKEFRIADGMVYDMDGDIVELFGNNKMF